MEINSSKESNKPKKNYNINNQRNSNTYSKLENVPSLNNEKENEKEKRRSILFNNNNFPNQRIVYDEFSEFKNQNINDLVDEKLEKEDFKEEENNIKNEDEDEENKLLLEEFRVLSKREKLVRFFSYYNFLFISSI